MKQFKILGFYAVLLAIPMLLPRPALASHICWIDHANSTSKGITLKFRPDVYLIGGIKYRDKQKIAHFVVEQGIASITSESGQQRSGTEVVLNVGDIVGLHQGVEDTCDVQAVVQGEKTGVLLRALSTMPPYGPSSSSEFVPAE